VQLPPLALKIQNHSKELLLRQNGFSPNGDETTTSSFCDGGLGEQTRV